jgi:hypothetical protein
MNTVRIGVITLSAAAGVSGYLSLRGAATDEAQPAQAARAQTEHLAASDQDVSRNAVHAPETLTLDKVRDPAFEPDASDLTQPSQTLDQVFDALNADIGPEGEYVDPEALAATLRSDPELGRLLNE